MESYSGLGTLAWFAPDDDIRRRILAAPSNLSKHYLVNANMGQFVTSPGCGLYNKSQMAMIGRNIKRILPIQETARENVLSNYKQLKYKKSIDFFPTLRSCQVEERFYYHPSHHLLNRMKQSTIRECEAIGIVGMLAVALHPAPSLAKSPVFGLEPKSLGAQWSPTQ